MLKQKIAIFEKLTPSRENDFGPGEAIMAYFNFWYSIGLCPFKLERCPNNGSCKVVSNRKHKIIAGVLTAIAFWLFVAWLLYMPSLFPDKSKVIKYFIYVGFYGDLFAFLVHSFTIWQMMDKFADLVNQFNLSMDSELPSIKTSNAKTVGLSMTLILLIASLIVWHLNALEQCDWNFKLFYTRNINFGKAMLFTHMSSVDSEETAESSGNRILFLIAYLAAIIATFTQSAGESMVMFMTTTLFYQIKILEKKAESMSIHEGIHQFYQIRLLLRKSGRAGGLAASGMIFGRIPHLFRALPQMLQPNLAFDFIRGLLYAFPTLLFLVFSAWLTNKLIEIIEQWLIREERFHQMPEPELSALLHQLENGAFEVEGYGFIKFTSGLLGEIISLILTFSVVLIQFGAVE